MKTKVAIAIAAALLSAACATTTPTSSTAATQVTPAVLATAPNSQAQVGQELTLKQIMADQDWVARSPESAYWMLDGSGVLYQQNVPAHSYAIGFISR